LPRNFYVTTPIYYVNAEPHLGHAYTTIVADVLSRFYRLSDYETFFLTGTDEHGEKIVRAANAAGQTPREYVDRISSLFRGLWPGLSISNNAFIRTTDEKHVRTVQYILKEVYQKGDIYFSEYEGPYCFGCERFLTERELVDGKCQDHQREPEVLKEANYFFRMSKYQDWLIGHINAHPDFIRPERYRNEVLSFLKEPLGDLCISRPKSRLSWGISLPFDDNFVTYVWFDALINYLSAIDYPEGEYFKKFWPVAQHVIAKDILKPHGIYWPCMLKAADIPPFRRLNVHGYWNVNEGKMSKSLGNVVRPLDLVSVYGLDAFRYFLMRDMVFGLDSEFSEEALVGRINADLANDLGNLVSRSLTMLRNYLKGETPKPADAAREDIDLKDAALDCIRVFSLNMRETAFHKALMAVWEVIGRLNKYIDATAPWVLAKSDRARLSTVLYHIAETLKIISALIWPVMPTTAERIQEMLGMPLRGADFTLEKASRWGSTNTIISAAKTPALFPRIERAADQKKKADGSQGRGDVTEKKDQGQGKKGEGAVEGLISIKDFAGVDLRVGVVRDAEPVPGSKKLMRLLVDVGEELGGERVIVAGILGAYQKDELVGKSVVVVANLEPAKLMGVESRGMVLAASDDSGLHLITTDSPARPGAKVK
jgi:methionyl-tRNA synthetase